MSKTARILKVDERGRVKTPRAKQEEMLEEFKRSGMTGMQFVGHIPDVDVLGVASKPGTQWKCWSVPPGDLDR